MASSSSLAHVVDLFVERALEGIARPFPVQMPLRLTEARDLATPRELTPIFFGAYDWHSACHGHWLLVRALRAFPDAAFGDAIRERLNATLTLENGAHEASYLSRHAGFERPYGLAWLLVLRAEVAAAAREGQVPPTWSEALTEPAEAARANLLTWLAALPSPSRSGTHDNTAFSLGLLLEASLEPSVGLDRATLIRHAERLHGADRALPLHLEPGGEDFLSGTLSAVDLMARVLAPDAFRRWLDGALPDGFSPMVTGTGSPSPDGRLAHLDGLLLSRAWMLRRIAFALPPADPRRDPCERLAAAHGAHGVARAIDSDDYARTHWLGTFVVYGALGAVTPPVERGARRRPREGEAPRGTAAADAGLCPGCIHGDRVDSSKGSTFWRCAAPAATAGRPGKKYPSTPVRWCGAFRAR